MSRILFAAGVSAGAGPDPSWILSTAAAAAATLLAIVGGFFVAQLIALVSEQHAADARLMDARDAYNEAQRNLSEATATLRTMATRSLLRDQQLTRLVAVRGMVSTEDAERCVGANDLLTQLSANDRRESIRGAVEMLAEMRERALNALICFIPVTDAPEPWERVKWKHFDMPLEDEPGWRAVYNVIAAQRAIEAAELKRLSNVSCTVAEAMQSHFHGGARSRMADMSQPRFSFETARETADALEALTAQVQATKKAAATRDAVEAAKHRRRELIPPAEFRGGVWLLIYLTIAVIFPLAILASGPSNFSFTIRYLVPAVLGFGVIVLLRFFWRLFNMARRPAIPLD